MHCQIKRESGNLQAQKKSVNFVEPSGGFPSLDVNGTLTFTDIQHQALIGLDPNHKPRFKVSIRWKNRSSFYSKAF